jgi:hypothetical protein
VSAPVPGRSTRGMCSAVLTFEAILMLLAIPVMATVPVLTTTFAVGWGAGLAAAYLVAVGLLGRSWGYAVGHALQMAFIALGFFAAGPAVLTIGFLFAGLWIAAYVIGMRIDATRAIR